jgi:5-methylcytosine-specific restriction endonuclease McrA
MKSSHMKLSIELVPQSSWGNNLRHEANIPKAKWDQLRRASYKKANYLCEVCGGRGPTHPVECHEIWEYDDQTKTQTLKGLISLCPPCHQVKHIGFALSQGKLETLEHLANINQMNPSEIEAYLIHVFNVWNERSQHQWKLDLSWLTS